MANVLFPQTAQKTRKRFQTGGGKKNDHQNPNFQITIKKITLAERI